MNFCSSTLLYSPECVEAVFSEGHTENGVWISSLPNMCLL
jgi:hypothetical protein